MSMSVATAPTSTTKDERFGRFVVVRALRKGGMGQLAMAFDPVSQQMVLLKRLPPNSAEDARTRFLDEIKLTTSLSHPNLVRAVDSGTIDGRDFLACEWIGGCDLERLLEATSRYDMQIPTAIVVGIFVQILDGLGAMHAANSLHRDVVPANVMLDYDGHAHLIDYGISTFEGRRAATQVGIVPGTLGFMAPELEDGQKASVASDLYGAAASLWFALTGLRMDHSKGSHALLAQLKQRRHEGMSPDLVTFLGRNLHRRPSERCVTAAEASLLLCAACAPAEPETIAEFIGSLFAGERSLLAQNLADLRARYPMEAPATVSEPPTLPRIPTRKGDTLALDRPIANRRPLLLVLLALVVALPLLGIAIWRATRTPTPIVHPIPTPPTPPPIEPPALPEPKVEAPSPLPEHPVEPAQVKASVPKPPTLSTAQRKRLAEAAHLTGMGRVRAAEALYTELADDPAAKPQALTGLARIAYKGGQYSDAVSFSSKAIAAGAGPDALMVRAAAHLSLRDARRAEADFAKVLALQPTNQDAAEGKRAAAALRGNQ
jgi:serine/threonine protein kinase